MEPKKISFGFSKAAKKPALLLNKTNKTEESKVELIKCLEGQEIKLVQERAEVAPMVIPMMESGKTSAALASLKKRRAVLLGEEDEPPPSIESATTSKTSIVSMDRQNESLEKRAARELLAELQKNGDAIADADLVLPVVKPDELPLDGAKESTMDDYEAIPIEQYGLAMLRGMGWVQPPTKDKTPNDDAPMVRPKGMGLGADKALKAKPLLVAPEKNEILEIKKQAYVRILGGKHKDAYGQIEGFDDEAGRIIVKMAIGGAREAFNEFLCQPVCKKEYSEYGKCINTAKYEEFKKLENEHGQIIIKKKENDEKKYRRISDDKKRIIKEEDDEKKHRRISDDKKRNIKDEDDVIYVSESKPDVKYRARYDNYTSGSGSSREKRRSRSRSPAQYSRHNLKQDYERDPSSGDTSESSTSSTSDSAYERRHKRHTKSKSHRRKSKGRRKHARHSSSDNSFSETDDYERRKHNDRKENKKHKKKTKKSKKQRSHTPTRHRK